MPGPVSSTAEWSLDCDQVLLAGVERLRRPATGYDIEKGIKALQFTFQRLAAMGLNLWTIEKVTLDLVAAAARPRPVIGDQLIGRDADRALDRLGVAAGVLVHPETIQHRGHRIDKALDGFYLESSQKPA